MSIKIMSAVFDHYPEGGGEMLLALAIADHAHDDGTKVYPSVRHLAEKTRQSERTVQYQLRKMEAAGWLLLVAGEKGGAGITREYRINPEWLKGANVAPIEKGCSPARKRVQPATERVQSEAEKGATTVAPEPSDNHQEPSQTNKGRSRPLFVDQFPLPEWIPSEAWQGFVEMRRALKKPLTDRAKRMAVKTLDQLRAAGHDPAEVLNQSTFSSWTGLYAPKSKPAYEQQPTDPFARRRGESVVEHVERVNRMHDEREARELQNA